MESFKSRLCNSGYQESVRSGSSVSLMDFIDDINTWNDVVSLFSCATDPLNIFLN